ncbi:two-component system, OmpR family, sensor kinase [Agreia bicolorata]|uniref:histidine kinase n=1 Tax=Agreia bicolorata TaxID=110935 RepID=A0A1T4XQZ5_9MICO|nr:HAMP domain-containing sensor histidine kinase [Agreia bicolorata]SKA91967.1 two-component system, OmpR family, sensor kinase [Agreia bicolorata]
MQHIILRRWNAISLRNKITGVTVLMLTFGLVVSGIGTMTVLRTYLMNQVDQRLENAYAEPTSVLGPGATQRGFDRDDVLSAPKTYFVALLDGNGQPQVTNWGGTGLPAPEVAGIGMSTATTLGNARFTVHSTKGSADWLAVAMVLPVDGYGTNNTLIIAQSLEDTENTTTTYLSIFLAFGIGVVVLGAMLTRLLVTSTFAPLRQVERTAAAIADGGDFSQRMAVETPNTEVGRLNRSLNTMLSRIDRAFDDRARTIEQMRRFVGDASHELRTPLVSVRGYAELYRMGALQTPEDVSQAMDRIEKEAIRMGSLVEDLLELARLDETKPLKLSPVNLVPIAMDAALDARASSPGRVIRVSTSRPSDPVITFNPAVTVPPEGQPDADGTSPLPDQSATGSIPFSSAFARLRRRSGRSVPSAPNPSEGVVLPATVTPSFELEHADDENAVQPLVMAEENKIRQVLANLIGNALRFTSDDSPIELAVSVDESNRLATVDVIDHGEGIPPQIREKIFQRFWRADSSRTRETGGSGLGLAIVSSIVAAHGGTVRALETEGGGATFRVSLPLLIEQASGESSTDSDSIS